MALSVPSGIVIEYDNSGGTLVDITAYVLTLGDVSIEQLSEENHPFGQSWEKNTPIGVGRVNTIDIGGDYDDTATTGPDALFGNRIPETPATNTRTLKITWRSGKTTSVETYLNKYDRAASRDGITKYTVTLQPTGAVTEV